MIIRDSRVRSVGDTTVLRSKCARMRAFASMLWASTNPCNKRRRPRKRRYGKRNRECFMADRFAHVLPFHVRFGTLAGDVAIPISIASCGLFGRRLAWCKNYNFVLRENSDEIQRRKYSTEANATMNLQITENI